MQAQGSIVLRRPILASLRYVLPCVSPAVKPPNELAILIYASSILTSFRCPQTHAAQTLARTAACALFAPVVGIRARAQTDSAACPARSTHHVSTTHVFFQCVVYTGWGLKGDT